MDGVSRRKRHPISSANAYTGRKGRQRGGEKVVRAKHASGARQKSKRRKERHNHKGAMVEMMVRLF